jgi:chemotaxis methyl-accepting protein methylase
MFILPKIVLQYRMPATPRFGNWQPVQERLKVTNSYLFRRSGGEGTFADIAEALQKAIKSDQPTKVMVVGVGLGEEPVSILTTVSHLASQKPIDEVIDLHCVDLCSSSDRALNVENHATLHLYHEEWRAQMIEKFARSSFEVEPLPSQPEQALYRLKKPIQEYLKKVFADCDPSNPQASSHWETPIEDFSQTAPGNSFDVISYNNVAMYLGSSAIEAETMNNLCRMVKPGCFLITDPRNYPCFKDFTRFKEGIWQKN